jgi:hypothetical protein
MEELKNILKKNPFKTPENYFEEIDERILAKTIDSDIVSKKGSINRRLSSFLKIAAALTGVALISYFTVKYLAPGIDSNALSGITIEQYTDMYSFDIDESELEGDFLEKEPVLSTDVTKSDIVNYLEGEDIYLSDIYELL